ncbi:MAG: hypothetical protein HYU66_23150 [Armatimonadetes bacterium]|nr:hypothetical protein [Armatimonadota bacterium]
MRASRVAAAILSVAIVAAVLLTSRPGSSGGSGGTPKDVIYDRLLPAMKAGDVRAYLKCFDEPLAAELRTAAETDGWAKLSQSLRAHDARVTGVAVTNEEVAGDEASLQLEWVYREDSDVQTVALRRANGRWLIRSLTPQRRARLPIPYGTEVIPGLKVGGASDPSDRDDRAGHGQRW